jgi:DNA replicative helicase MCM subunit Mcm2 (Cdc46/Mcm family)
LDKSNERIDSHLAQHILRLYSPLAQSNLTKNTRKSTQNIFKKTPNEDYVIKFKEDGMPEDSSVDLSKVPLKKIPITLFAKYIAYARHYIFPRISPAAETEMISKYIEMRKMGMSKNTITASPRQLESMIRLSEALAKMRFSDTVELYDVNEALRLIRVALHQSATDPRTGTIDMSILTTGNTSSINEKIDKLVELFKEQIGEMREIFRESSLTFERFKSEINQRVNSEFGELSEQEISMTLARLEEENSVVLIGNKYSNKYRIKLMH